MYKGGTKEREWWGGMGQVCYKGIWRWQAQRLV